VTTVSTKAKVPAMIENLTGNLENDSRDRNMYQQSLSRVRAGPVPIKYLSIHVLNIDPISSGMTMPDGSPLISTIIVSGPVKCDYDLNRFIGKLPFQRLSDNRGRSNDADEDVVVQLPHFPTAGIMQFISYNVIF